MGDESKPTATELSSRITEGMGLVYELYTEMDAFFSLISETLRAERSDIRSLSGSYVLPRTKKATRPPAENYLAVEMGALFAIDAIPDDEDEEADPGSEEEPDDDDKKGVQVSPTSRFAAVRVQLFDPRVKHEFVPIVAVAILRNVVKAKRKPKDGDETETKFSVPRGALKKLVRQVDAKVTPGILLKQPIAKHLLTAEVAFGDRWPLATLDSEDKVIAMARQLVEATH